ncbi:MAG TPA: DUF1552 domain-containing protein [Vicinamibacterales bacterium]|nr:DUF1552 domain-containing protein [Vicinamibacterales bacterium]
MFISKLSLPRRTFLRGLGATVALPLLDAMVPALTATSRTAANAQRRLGFVYVPNGMIMDQWTPSDSGNDFAFTPILKPLEFAREHLVVLSNFSRPGTDADHALASSGWLSGVTAKETEGQDFRLGRTIDQVIAEKIGDETPLRSLEVATEDFAGYVGGCSPGYACAYVNTLSWASPTTPLPMEINPRVVFERMFGRAGTPAQRALRMQTNRSVLDSITADLNHLEREVPAPDRSRIDEYLTDIREIEQRIQRMEQRASTDIVADAPEGIPESFEEHVALMFSLLTLAYQSDLTRVFTFMMAREFSMKTYSVIGVSEPHHSVSHHQNRPEQIAKHAKINVYHVQQFAKFIDKLSKTRDGDGSLLDHSLIFYGGGLSNGNTHSPYPLPLLALGGGAGKGDRHFKAPERSPIGNLWVGVADQYGCDVTRFGESNGRADIS